LPGLLRITLATVAVVGFGYSIYHNQRLSRLRQTHTDLRKRVGLLEVEDPGKVAITHVPVSDEAIPPGVSEAYVWQYRIYIPANYGPCYQTKQGLVKADSPQGKGGTGTSWSSPQPEPEEVLATMALIKSDGKWLFCNTTGSGSRSSSVPDDFAIASLADLLVEPVVQEGETRVFDTDEAICLFRLRDMELATNRNGETEKDLYRGFVVYVFNQQYQEAFGAWASGKASSMKEAQR
jgi:hypothetical protein